jgi:hypothetical protein
MFKSPLAALLLGLAILPPLTADDRDPPVLARAKEAHSKELAKLRADLLAAIDTEVKRAAGAGEGIDYLLKEKKGFAENGVTPILPKLVRHSRTYLDGKKAADERLEKAYTTAIEAALARGDGEAVTRLRKEVKDLRAAGPATPDRATAQDEKVERDIARAKDEYAAAWTRASADLIAAIEEARTRVAASKSLPADEKLKLIETLAAEKRGFEAGAALPKSATMRADLQLFHQATRKAQEAFGKAMEAAASAYLVQKDEVRSRVVVAEKKRLLARPNSIDLLALVDPENDQIVGGWEVKNGVLTLVQPAELSVVQIPYEPGREYNLHLTAERLDGAGYFAVGIVVGDRQCTVMCDGWPEKGHQSGLQLINGKYLFENGTAVTGRQFPPRKAVHLDIAVRRGSINAWVQRPADPDKHEILKYTGPQDGLDIETDFIKGIRNTKALFLHQHTSRFAVSTITLEPVGREPGKRTR